MPVCSYVVLPRPGSRDDLTRELADIDGCEVIPARNAQVLLLVTTTDSFEGDVELRRRVEAMPGIEALLMTFGEIDPQGTVTDPLLRGRGRRPHERHHGEGEAQRGVKVGRPERLP